MPKYREGQDIEINNVSISKSVLNGLPGISLNDMKENVNAYTLDQFPYSKDVLPCVILLLPDEESKQGHYVALAQSEDQKTLYYWDSYGYNPLKLFEEHPEMMNDKQDIEKWGAFLQSYDNVNFNDVKFQDDDSRLCGYWCLSYIFSNLSRVDFTPELFANMIERFHSKYKTLSYDNIIVLYYLKAVLGVKKDKLPDSNPDEKSVENPTPATEQELEKK